jgi:hypothetical protein|tara:strand:- start:1115 stop:1636 length:522 start_codon:yes stop_codon:yes gene_type:complete
MLIGIGSLIMVGCKSNPFGKKVKEPFSGSSYESNNRFFRGTGKGTSSKDNIAWSKADMNAKVELAGQVNTTMKQVTDQYFSDKSNESAGEALERFESLARQSMNTQISNLIKIGEKKYFDGEKYTVFMAYEIKKRAMLKFMKKQAKLDAKYNDDLQKEIIKMLEEEINKIPEE